MPVSRSKPAALKYPPNVPPLRGWLMMSAGFSIRFRTEVNTAGGELADPRDRATAPHRAVLVDREHPEVAPRERGELFAADPPNVLFEAHLDDLRLEVVDPFVVGADGDVETVRDDARQLELGGVARVGERLVWM